jgi:iron complex transport system substrate-binding protein
MRSRGPLPIRLPARRTPSGAVKLLWRRGSWAPLSPRSRGTVLAILLLAPSASALTLTGCSADAGVPAPADDPSVVRDDRGVPFPAATPPARIISLVPSITEVVELLGEADRLVARTDYDRAPGLARLPSVGGGLTPNIEALVALQPGLVLISPDAYAQPILQRLEAVGIPAFAGRIDTVEDLRRLVANLGELFGSNARERGGSFLDSLDAGFRALDEAQAAREAMGQPRARVLYLIGVDPPMSVGPGTFIDSVVRSAGGEGLFPDASTPWPRVALEEILVRDPDWIVLAGGGGGPERLASSAGWRELRAVREGRVVLVDGELFNRPGPRVLEAARTLAGILHP